jgi:hypothetical protein
MAASVLAPSIALAQSQQRLTFADDETLAISVKGDAKTASKSVVVVNSGPPVKALTFQAVSEEADAHNIDVAPSGSSAIPATAAAPIKLTFTADESLDGFQGQLIAATDGAATERDLTFDAKNELPYSVNLIIFGSLVLGVALCAIRARTRTIRPRLAYRITTPGWDFSKSWASTFTVVGALLGTVLASTALPDTPERFSKETLAGMSLLFGVAILLAPLLCAVAERPREVEEKDGTKHWQGQTTVAGYLRACALTLTGVVGQLVTVFFLLSEIEAKGGLPGGALDFMGVLLGLALLLVLIYAWRTMDLTAQNAKEDKPPAERAGPEGPAFSASLL